MFSKCILVFSFIFYVQNFKVDSLKLPKYVKACSLKDPKLNECGQQNGQAAIPRIVQGDRKYRIPKLNPLVLEEMSVDHGSGNSVGMKLVCRDVNIHGLENSIVEDFEMDPEKKKLGWKIRTPMLKLLGNYEISGRILLLPIAGKGDLNLTLIDYTGNYKFDYLLEKNPKDNLEYLKLDLSHFSFDLKKGHINMSGLFNDDRVLGPQMNRFLNENWKEVQKELSPTIAESFRRVVNSIVDNICSQVPFQEIFKND